MKSQTLFEYSIILAVGLIIAIFAFSMVYDIPSTIENVRQRSYRDYWAIADIAILSHAFNGTNATLVLVNNQKNQIYLNSLDIGSISLSPNLSLAPAESVALFIPFETNLTSGEPYEYLISFEYLSLDNNRIYGFTGDAPLTGVISGNLSQ